MCHVVFSRLVLFLVLFVAIPTFGQAPEKPRAKPEVQALIELAQVPAKEFKWDEALRLYSDALKKAEELNDPFSQGLCWQRLGNTYYSQGNLLKARDSFEKAKEWYGKAGDKDSEMGMLGNLAVLKDNMGYPLEARPIYLQLLAHYREKGNKRGTANMLTNLAILSRGIDEDEDSLKYASEARVEYKALADKRWEANAVGLMAGATSSLGRKKEAIQLFEETILIAREAGSKLAEASALGGLGDVLRQQGELVRALDVFQQVLKIREETSDLRFTAMVCKSIAIVYDLLGQSRLAIAHLNRAADLAKKVGDRPSHASALGTLGVVLQQAGKFDEAKPVLKEALALHRSTGSKIGEGSCLGTLGAIYRDSNQYADALATLHAAKEIYRKGGYREEEATLLDSIGNVLMDQSRFKEAIPCFRQAIVLYDQIPNRRFAATTWGNLGRTFKKMGRLAEAEACYAKFVELVEDVRSSLGATSEGKSEFLGRRIGRYHNYISLLVERGKASEAFDLAQRTKGRSLLDLLGAGGIAIQREMADHEIAQERDLRFKADKINAQMVSEGARNEVGAKKRFAALKVELQKAENDIAAFATKIFAKYPGLAQKRSARPASLAQIASRLPKDTALLEYIAAETPMVFVVTSQNKKGRVTATTLAKSRKELLQLCADYHRALSNPKLPFENTSKVLFNALLKPIEGQLKGYKRIIVCPDGPLWDVSFAALSNGKFLAERFEIDYAFSGTTFEAVLQPNKARLPKKTLLVLANPDFGGAARFGDNPLILGQRPIDQPSRPIGQPSRPIDQPSRPIDQPSRPIDQPSRPIDNPSRPIDHPSRAIETPSRAIEPPSRDLGAGLSGGIVDLPGTQREADALASLFPGADVLTRGRAQESALVGSAGQYRYIHIASHAFFNDASPMLSSIVLAVPGSSREDGYLTAREVFDLKLNADLVVLSACNTARGEKQSGEGIVGLSWALFAAGAPAQVVSQWSVDDRATATLMKRFYGNMKAGHGKGRALKNAALSLIDNKAAGNDRKWRHPYYWAPFILIGDWR